MSVLILDFSANQVNEDRFTPNKIGLTFFCIQECEKELKTLGSEVEHIKNGNICKNISNKIQF